MYTMNTIKRNTYKKKYDETHKEEIKVYQKIYRDTHKAKIKVSQKKYYDIHREEKIAYQKEYRETHKAERKVSKKAHLCYKDNMQILENMELNKKLIETIHSEAHRAEEELWGKVSFPDFMY